MYALISCTKLKQDKACLAREMYLKSTLFSKAVRYIELKGYDDWFILSAKYGLLNKDEVIEPYDVTLNNMKSAEKKEWSRKVADQIQSLKLKNVDFYAGANYREHLLPLLDAQGVKFNVPLLGKGIGEQLQFYTRQMK
ncbi:DUF6884 domain-containing protein [Paenibacillus sp. GP183]|uniref:DUF6884 domain-containing protein n=1 Tax=Paenibacillus sp. GP183 TaxID=1882751 RepID=UPI000895C1A0|nr:DUF6884 domain-containing protein [Paenibacillus sp. GP183]SEB45795.1 hypothetical protein SAMN05443246_0460 [Paenibacillus sp. GP183]